MDIGNGIATDRRRSIAGPAFNHRVGGCKGVSAGRQEQNEHACENESDLQGARQVHSNPQSMVWVNTAFFQYVEPFSVRLMSGDD